jgi:AcrR family transcriptional regulator
MKDYQDNKKFEIIVDTARGLFWRHGISRVSIEEICREANVSKMTFYRFFTNKSELGKKVIDDIIDEGIQKYNELMEKDISFEEKIRSQLLLKFEGTKEISAELIKDIFSNDKLGLKEHWLNRAKQFSEKVRSDYFEAQKKGWIRKDLNLDLVFYLNNKIVDIFSDPNLLALYDNMQEAIMDYGNLIFYGILPRHNEKSE